jgi:hypothetical protein
MIQASAAHQTFVDALLNDAAIFKDQYAIRLTNGG